MSQALEHWLSLKKENLNEMQMLKKDIVEDFIQTIWGILFPGYSDEILDTNTYFELKLNVLKKDLALLLHSVEQLLKIKLDVEELVSSFVEKLPEIDDILGMDLEAIFDGDPASNSKTEIILCYPGFYAIFMYRIANELSKLNIPLLPRILSEEAHSRTGIDIHPSARIGHHFFIDHGTGIVIGETTIIGNYVKLYQGVTLGALSLKDGHRLKGRKRHPTILDHVTIYSEASIFGGDTVIGPNVTIGSNAFITSSVPEHSVISRVEKN
ncbi:MAG: serine acetyltransferase [Roseburia sp.]|nr:hypothetical protein [Anaeroplasma bactoclasticum]MCM1195962.1 serine acetyltransferase [Roseburia sp.]MCM1555896.1 hypothetical protein [Anaeroplasma bactoclasticum]